MGYGYVPEVLPDTHIPLLLSLVAGLETVEKPGTADTRYVIGIEE
jgi:hypothetical protein